MLITFMLVSARVGGLFLGAPILSRRDMPRRFKVILIFAIAGLLGPVAVTGTAPTDAGEVVRIMFSELVLGASIGLLARFMIAAFQLAGTMMGRQMGFAMANGFDPETQSQSSVVASLHTNMAAFMFLLLDGHHMLLRAMAASYESFPMGGTLESAALAETMMMGGARIFNDGARIAGPVTGIMLLINVMLGFMNKINPQLSIFNVGLPLTVMSGLVAVLISTPDTIHSVIRIYEVLVNDVATLVAR